ncbi:MAG TPA: protein kinase [Polyangiaceae bacterium]|nr:protein kinase [Polyangiaceae bacterium]
MSTLPRPGDVVGTKYRVVRVIGEGGMGTVYEARHETLGTVVALKFLHPDLQASPALVARFLQEARVSASLRNPHVTQVMDVDQTPDGAAYLVMELLHGESLEKRMEKQSPLPLAEAVDIALQTLSALEAAHSHGVVHRDLKPDNVWLSPTPAGAFVKLLDFGIAKLRGTDEFKQVNTRPGSMMGTPAYMSPEQAISADQVDARADLYSFGVILFEMLSGKRPVDVEDPSEIIQKLARGEVRKLASVNATIPPALASLVDRLVRPNPDDRPSSAEAVRAELVPHARASGMVWQWDRPSAVPATLPPDVRGAPAFAPTAPEPTRAKTAAMPMAAELPYAQTAVAPPPAGVSPPRRRRAWPWVVLVSVALLGGAGTWVAMNPSVLGDDVLPPMPTDLPAPTAATAPPEVTPVLPPVEPSRPEPVRPARPATPSSPGGTTSPVSPAPVPTFPQFPALPPFTIPSGLIPSSLPPYFPQIPGITVPIQPTAAAPTATAAAPTAPGATAAPPAPPSPTSTAH